MDNVQLQNSCTNYLKEINSLRNDLQESAAVINDYRYKMDTTKNETDRKIDVLLEQARQFQEFMKNPHPSSSQPPPQSTAASSPLDQQTASTVHEVEHRVREEMAKIFAGQIKQMEKQFKEQIVKFEHNLEVLRDELDEQTDELKISQQDVAVLKFTVLTERKEAKNELQQKEIECKQVMDRQAALIKRLQAEIEKQEQTVKSLFGKLHESQNLQESERQKMEDDRRTLLDREEALIERCKKHQEDHSKYREKIKREGATMTRENEILRKKCVHLEAEATRLSENFKKIRDRLQIKLQETIETIQTENRTKLEHLEKDYKAKLHVLEAKNK
jgi:centrosomal protein CEP152